MGLIPILSVNVAVTIEAMLSLNGDIDGHGDDHVGVHLHQASVSTLQQLCDDASDSVIIGNNSVT